MFFSVRLSRAVCAAAAILALAGCGGQSLQRIAAADVRLPAQVELHSTPFHPQSDYQCGPAALATVLEASGTTVTPEELVAKVYVPALKGSLQAEMISATRTYDRLAYRVPESLDGLMTTLADGVPALVLLNLGIERVPFWHYAVVIGFDTTREEWLLRSGTQRRDRMAAWRFEGAWRRAGRWGIAVVEPGIMPASAPVDRYVEGAAGLESAGRLPAALAGFNAAARRHPDHATARLGLGNVRYGLGQLAAAEADYRATLRLQPGNTVAHNNLAQVLLERDRPEEALAQVEAARASLADPRFAAALEATESAIRAVLRDRAAQP